MCGGVVVFDDNGDGKPHILFANGDVKSGFDAVRNHPDPKYGRDGRSPRCGWT